MEIRKFNCQDISKFIELILLFEIQHFVLLKKKHWLDV